MQRETDAIELPAAGARCEKGRTSMGAADNRRHLRQVSHWSHSHSSMLAKLAMLSAASLARLEALSLPVSISRPRRIALSALTALNCG